MKCKPSKCEILRDSIKYLGSMVDKHGVRLDPVAVEAVLTRKAPKNCIQLMSSGVRKLIPRAHERVHR